MNRLTAFGLFVAACLSLIGCGAGEKSTDAKTSLVPPPSPMAAKQPATQPSTAKKTLLMHYLAWYQTPSARGTWGFHWAGPGNRHDPSKLGADGLADIWSNYHPLIGPYDSSDPDAIECHLLQMKFAGVDGVIVDWYGISHTADYSTVHEATRNMFGVIDRYGMKFAVCFEDRTVKLMVERGDLKPEQVPDHMAQTIQWMRTNWFSKPQYFRFEGRPLFLDFGPVYVHDPGVWNAAFGTGPDRPLFFALQHVWKKAGADGAFTWVYPDVWKNNPDPATIRQRLKDALAIPTTNPDQVIVSACPGFKDVYEHHYPVIEHRDGKTMQETLEAAMASPSPLVQLVTWNDYGEGTIIEPTHEFGYTFLETVQKARRAELGNTFAYTSADLRLPAKFYALRKSGRIPSARLNQIAEWLRAGECAKAASALGGD